LYYTYNFNKHKWNTSKEDIFLPLVTPFSLSRRKAWCSVHKQWETCAHAHDGKIYFSCGTPLQSQLASIHSWTLSKVQIIPEYSRKMLKVRSDYIYTNVNGTKKNYRYAYKIWTFFMSTGITSTYESEQTIAKVKDSLPEIIFNEIQSELSAIAEKTFDSKYTNISPKKDYEGLKDYVLCPACPQIADLQYFLGNNYSKIINRKNPNPYQDVCTFLHIKPFKRLRRIFDKNPLALPLYEVLKNWGFTDVNVMTKFLEDKTLCTNYFKTLKYDYKKRRIFMIDSDYKSNIFMCLGENNLDIVNIVNRWVKESLQVQSEKITMNHLIKAMNEGYTSFYDAAKMYYNRAAAIPPTLKDRIKKECFTIAVHDELIRVLPNTFKEPLGNYPIEYTEADKNLETIIKDEEENIYEFILPKDTNQIFALGDAMHNCVGHCYRIPALNRGCTIVGVKINNIYSACIEIKNIMLHPEILQAKGVCNSRLKINVQKVIKKWASERNISCRTGDFDYSYHY